MKNTQNPISKTRIQFLLAVSTLICMQAIPVKADFASSEFPSEEPITCVSHMNLSLGSDCTFTVLASTIVESPCCDDDQYDIEITDAHGHVLSTNVFNSSHLGYCFDIHVTSLDDGNQCWGEICVEDKLAPSIACLDETIPACYDENLIVLPVVTESCGTFVLDSIETIQRFDCPSVHSALVTRIYTATDEWGNTSHPCTKEILIERVDLDEVVCPVDPFEISCLIEYDLDDNDHPHPSVSGCPTLNGTMLCDLDPSVYCDLNVSYSDRELGILDCTFKILRTWTIVGNGCGAEETMICEQLLKISDLSAPTFTCPAPLTLSLNQGCMATVDIPALATNEVACSGVLGVTVDVFYENTVTGIMGSILDFQGGSADLTEGENEITYRVTDDCGNSDECMTTITVQDGVSPVALCEINLTIALTGDDITNVYAESFDKGNFVGGVYVPESYDNCDPTPEIAVARMESDCTTEDIDFDDHVGFCCADVGTTVMVMMRVTDNGGNTNVCMVSVDVQNKLDLELNCPASTSAACTDDLSNLAASFDPATIFEKCESSGTIVETVDRTGLDACGIGMLVRNFDYVVDGVSVASCSQVILVNGVGSFTEVDNIDWPNDILDGETCDFSTLDPDVLDEEFAYPRYVGFVCQNATHDYTDEIFSFAGSSSDACVKILRNWTVTNPCIEIAPGVPMTFTHQQTIKVTNSMDPSFTGSFDALFSCSNDPANCGDGTIALSMTGEDDCTEMIDLNWSYLVTDLATGLEVASGTTNDASGDYAIGTYDVLWTVEDGCGNKVSQTQSFEISSCLVPDAVCQTRIGIELGPMDLIPDPNNEADTEMAMLNAADLNLSSSHPCGTLIFSFSENINDTERPFDCDNITDIDPVTGNGFGLVTLDLYVTLAGTDLSDNCSIVVEVQDNNNVDICDPNSNRPNISGGVSTPDLRMIEEVKVELMGTEMEPSYTNQSGYYAFSDVLYGNSYDVTPSKNDAFLNGVSTLDIVNIQKHIVGKEKLDSPYKLIAADINNDGNVSSIDLIELRKLILGLYESLPQNTSWRFVDKNFEFIDPANPFAANWEESYQVNDFSNDMQIDFVGIKIGDVNHSSKVNQEETSVESRTQNDWTLIFDNKELSRNKTASVELKSKEDISLTGLQMQFSIAQNAAKIISVESPLEGFSVGNYHINKQGKLNISWNVNDGNIAELKASDVVLVITIEGDKQVDLEEVLQLEALGLKNEAYSQAGINGIDLEAQGQVVEETNPQINGLELFQNVPNPWSDATTIKFQIPFEDDAELRFYNSRGELLFNYTNKFPAGMHHVRIDSDKLDGAGIIIYKLIYRNHIESRKMVLMK